MMMILRRCLLSHRQSYPPHYLLQQKIFPHSKFMARLYVTKLGIKGIMSSGNRWYRCCLCFYKRAHVAWSERLIELVLHCWLGCWLPAGHHPLLKPAVIFGSATYGEVRLKTRGPQRVAVPEHEEIKKQPKTLGGSSSV